MRRVFLLLPLTVLSFTVRTQVSIDTYAEISGGYFNTSGLWNGRLLDLNSSWVDNWLRFSENGTEHGRIGFSSAGGLGNLMIRNSNTGFGDLVELRGGNGGRFYMYPDGKLYANNLGDIGNNRDMHWNQTTGEIGWTSSSARYKTNISGMEEDWTKILQVSPVTYNRPNSPDHWEHGYLAEDLDSIGLQPLVGYSAEGEPDYIHYDKIVLYLTEMLKMHEAIIAKQEEEIDLLKRKVNEIYSLKSDNQPTDKE